MPWVWNRQGLRAEPLPEGRTPRKFDAIWSFFVRDEAIWGDGFCDDELLGAFDGRDLQAFAPAEYIRVIPGVSSNRASNAFFLGRHLAACASARAWRLRRAPAFLDPRAKAARDGADVGKEAYSTWFAGPDAPLPSQVPGEIFLCRFADEWARRVQEGAIGDYDEPTASLLAFATGVHPAYLWDEALVSHELHLAAGWLGVLNRGYRAYMPADVAEYFLDVIVPSASGRMGVRDPRIAPFLQDEFTIDHIRRVALRRRKGGGVTTKRLPPLRAPQFGFALWSSATSEIKPLWAATAAGGRN